MTETIEQAPETTSAKSEIQVYSKKTDRKVQFEKSFGDSLDEATSLYGADVVFSIFNQQAVIKCQSKVRLVLDKGGSEEDAVAAGQNYTPGVTTRARVSVDPIAQLAAKVTSGELSMGDLQAQLEAQLAKLTGGEE